MEEPLQFTPQLGDLYATMAVCGLAFAGLVWLALRLNKLKHPDPRRRVLLPMLAYFVSLLALMGFLGAFWSSFKYPPVVLQAREMTIGKTTYPLPKAREIRLETYPNSGLNPSTRVLLVQTNDMRTWAFPESRYPVNEMLTRIKGSRE
ncbi:hypothetical protein QWY85_16570 [Neolewinella lacunae]|uniref:Uncharacterized protein n=1 Tax=Neolewinella lacunae TaxID=1517758 RepID=A0A923PIY2_9BACT|nr:hypothetical protein [Neolewinella lacunae]MBC6993440.1 hypothetical protein [Neolewinella lacunae]MDN3636284.1 hypothetical protein [Neolewinella lacunae]